MISFITVVRNEEKLLRSLLEGVQKYVSEIIVVDDESSDSTLDIAVCYAIKLIIQRHVGYCEPGLQVALRKCSYPWVLRLDADEMISKGDLKAIKSWTAVESAYDSVRFSHLNYIDDRFVREESKVRLVKREVLQYSGKLHTEEEGYKNTFQSPWKIYHRKTKARVIENFKRYIELLKVDDSTRPLLVDRAKEYGVLEELGGML